ncbi:MAG: hypothetical protein ACP5RD_06930 [bacterium]
MIVDILDKNEINLIYYKAGILREEKFDDITKINIDLFKKSKELIVLIPDSFLITKALTIPTELKSYKAIKSNLYKNLPVSPNLTYNSINLVGSKLYFIGIKKENIDNFLKYFYKLKINKIHILPNSFAIKEVYNFDKPNYIILNLTSHYLSISSFEKGGYFFFSILPYNIDSFKIDPNDLQANKIVNEIYRIVSSFQAQTKINIEGIYLFANTEYKELVLLDLLKRSLGNLSFVLKQDNYYPLYEKILSHKKFSINLDKDELEEKVNLEKNQEIFNKFLLVYLFLLIFVSLITYLGINKKYNTEKNILLNLENTYNSLKIPSLSSNIQNDRYIDKVFLIIYRINQINKNVLKEIYFNSISYNKGDLILNFVCFDYDKFLLFQNSLKENLKDIALITNIQSNKKIITIDEENQIELIDNTIEIKIK